MTETKRLKRVILFLAVSSTLKQVSNLEIVQSATPEVMPLYNRQFQGIRHTTNNLQIIDCTLTLRWSLLTTVKHLNSHFISCSILNIESCDVMEKLGCKVDPQTDVSISLILSGHSEVGGEFHGSQISAVTVKPSFKCSQCLYLPVRVEAALLMLLALTRSRPFLDIQKQP
ncbi:uncharacterized protein V6R79_000445 [Siganus canaliculatus]